MRRYLMRTSKTCILFDSRPIRNAWASAKVSVDEKDLAVDEDNFRRSISDLPLGRIIAEGCDRILADAGCYALPYVEK